MRIICIGDALVDYYSHQGTIYPGGNAVNVAVMAKRNNAEDSAYLGLLGLDKEGNHIISSLKQEGICIKRVRRLTGPTGIAEVTLSDEGDRIFVSTNKEQRVQSLATLRLNQDDLDYINEFDIVHTCVSINTGIESELPKIAHKKISFDFSTPDYWTKDYLQDVCPYLTYAFFSCSQFSRDEVFELINYVHQLGVPVIGVTRGEKSCIFSKDGQIYELKSKLVDVVDTMGAGDSFIAAFVTSYLNGEKLETALCNASNFASNTCSFFGSFGYGLKLVNK